MFRIDETTYAPLGHRLPRTGVLTNAGDFFLILITQISRLPSQFSGRIAKGLSNLQLSDES